MALQARRLGVALVVAVMPLGGRWHRRDELEVIPVYVPTLIVDPSDPAFNSFALPGEYLLIDGLSAHRLNDDDLRRNLVCDEAPEVSIQILRFKDVL